MSPITTSGPASLMRWAPRVALLSMSIGLLAVFCILMPALFYRIGVYDLDGAFRMTECGAYVGILAVVVALIGLIMTLITRRSRHLVGSVIGIVLGVLAWGIPSTWLKNSQSLPAIHDISTDTVNAPRFQSDVLALRKGSQNSAVYAGPEIAAQQSQAYPDIQPMLFKLPAAEVYAAAIRTVQAMHWKLDSNDPVIGVIEATSTTLWLGLQHDLVIRIQALGNSSRLDIRSESRAGKSDAGKNAQLIRAFRVALYKQLGLQLPRRY